jgi:DNA-binding NtrC family response regulator
MTLQEIKNRFRIIGNSPLLDRDIDIARQVASTDLSVLITGESGTGKEVFPQIIHQLSPRKHAQYIAVNCGAIPEGTIDSELFGHEKGSFTGAHDTRKGYFEVADGGTIFLDEVGDLPLPTQIRLLRVLETGEFIRVGSSKVLKTDVRIVAATNTNVLQLIEKGRFREDLYYRLNTVPLIIPPLRERKEDIPILFMKFAVDFADKNKMPPIRLTPDAQQLMMDYYWKGNIRQLKNVTEQISVLEKTREIDAKTIAGYLPDRTMGTLPALYRPSTDGNVPAELTDRDLLYKVLFDMRKDVFELKKIVFGLLDNGEPHTSPIPLQSAPHSEKREFHINSGTEPFTPESFSLEEKEKELIIKSMAKHQGNRKFASKDLGISQRTLYRKLKEYGLENS